VGNLDRPLQESTSAHLSEKVTLAVRGEVILVATAIDTMIDHAATADVMTTVAVLLEVMMTTSAEATVAVAVVVVVADANEMRATAVVALESTDMKAADATTIMVQVVIDEVEGAMNAEMIVSEAMVARHLRAMRLLVSPPMVVVETILLAKIATLGDKLLDPKGPAILHDAHPLIG